ncbi:MAG: tRNA (adenosine(37)-N6)-dimethylallyltransferase MiaA [Succinivibrionaceae bacterium]|nr:tRNA (adenosine(37)-N6)-dimethylallyltransferase MiaA [Succinivibrionaceae bacterium]
MSSKPIVCIMGPTASGKTKLAIELAHRISGEIISVDSALIYRGMDIGTAKPTLEEREGIPHYLIDIADPSEVYSAANFRSDALRLIKDIQSRNKVPILAGGTMLYFNALIGGISNLPCSEPEVRAEITGRVEKEGIESLHRYLAEFDPESAARIKPTDSQRIIRAVEIYLISGKTMTRLTAENKQHALDIPSLQFAILPREREELRKRIAARFSQMVEQGLVEEVKALMDRGDLNPDLPSMRCVGYRQCWSYLKGETDFDEMIYRGTVDTCQLAKRQITWLRGWKFPLHALNMNDPCNLPVILSALKSFNN